VLVPRIGAIVLLVGFGFALSSLLRTMVVVALEGYSSWIGVLAVCAPVGVLAGLSAYLVLMRKPWGYRLVWPLVVCVVALSVITFAKLPPVGTFLDDYEDASLARGVDVPEYRAEQGWSERDYVESRTNDIRSQGVLGALGAVGLYALLVRWRAPRAPRASKAASA
jgi:hypothetical protein